MMMILARPSSARGLACPARHGQAALHSANRGCSEPRRLPGQVEVPGRARGRGRRSAPARHSG
eukprot:121167-Hanusia_phi.AAC.2